MIKRARYMRHSYLDQAKKLKAFNYINALVLILIASVMLFPFLNVLLTSFASFEDVAASNIMVIPKHFTLDSYRYVFATGLITKPFFISLGLTVCGTIFNLLMTVLGAHVLASKTLPGRKGILFFVIFTMFFGGGLIPFVTVVQNLGMLNSYAGLIIPFSISTFNLIIMRNSFRSLPGELLDASRIDGANEFRLLFTIIIPLSLPALSTIGLYYAVERWNDWYWPMIFLEDTDMFPLALTLRSLLIDSSSDMSIIGGYVPPDFLDSKAKESAVVIISILPMIMIFPFIQKFFIKGVLIGAVKD